MIAGIVERSGHSGEALYNILPAALSKHEAAKSVRCAQMLPVPFFLHVFYCVVFLISAAV